MITVTRSLARQLRATFRRLFNARGSGPALTFTAGPEGLSVRVKSSDAAIEYLVPGDFSPDTFTIPIEVLDDFDGRKEDPVRLERISKEHVTAEWQDGGVPQMVRYNALEAVDGFPPLPETFVQNPPSLWHALKEAGDTTDPDSIRYAIGHILLKGATGTIASTDGRQLLVQSGFEFPWDDQVLVPRSKIFGSAGLSRDQPVDAGRAGDWVVLRSNPWTVWLAINREGRFPEVERHVPQPGSATARLLIDPSDAAFLESALSKLPADETNNWPVTVDLNGSLAIRARPSGQARSTELVLARSERVGDPIRLNTNRKFLARALKMGFREVLIYGDKSPVLCQDEHRQYLWALLDSESAIEPSADAIRIDSASIGTSVTLAPATHPKKERRIPPVNRVEQTNRFSPEKVPQRVAARAAVKPRATSKRRNVADLIEQAETVRSSLRETLVKTNELLKALKQHRRETRAVRSTLASLRQLQTIGV